MSNEPTEGAASQSGIGPAQLMSFGKDRTEAMLNLQREMLDELEQASRAWITRMRSEIELWSDLATKVTASRSVPEGLGAYRECVSQRMQMAVDDGRHLLDEGQKIAAAVTKSLHGSAQSPHQDNKQR